MIGELTTLGVVLSVGLLSISALLVTKRYAYSYYFLVLCCCSIIWTIANYYLNNPLEVSAALSLTLINEIAFAAGYGIVLAGMLFTYYFPSPRRVSKQEWIGVALLAVITVTSSFSERVVGGATLGATSVEYHIGPLIGIYVVGFLVTVGLMCRNLLQPNIGRESKSQRAQRKLLVSAFAATAIGGLLLNLLLPIWLGHWHTTEIGPLVVLAMAMIVAYAIARHGMFDIRLAAARAFTYVLSIMALAAVYFLAVTLISIVIFGDVATTDHLQLIVPAVLLAVAFQPIQRFFDKITDRVFYHDTYSTETFYADINSLLSLRLSLRGLMRKVSTKLVKDMKVESAIFVVLPDDSEHRLTASSGSRSKLVESDMLHIERYLERAPEDIVLFSALDYTHPLFHVMEARHIELLLPLHHASRLAGYAVLGRKRAGQFTKRDTRVLRTISGELVIAIENALSLLEVEELNATLQYRVNEATTELRRSNKQLRKIDEVKDEFLSVASHQLRTPLTSVKGYISLVLDGDAGKINSQQRHLLNEAFTSSQRMVHLIEDFLNMSRLQTGRFVVDKHPSDVVKMVRDEVESLKTTAEARSLKLLLHTKGTLPTALLVDEGKLRQVVMNFIDNAIYYSNAGGTIDVYVECKADVLSVQVKDSGIGVPASAQAQLFGKFYRAGNARLRRPDGTGIGLYLAKKVVTEHGGEIIFSSKEGKGSTFGFSLPASKLDAREEKTK